MNQLTKRATENLKRENLVIAIGCGIVLSAYFVTFVISSNL